MPVTVVWFRDDLRVRDHEPLVRACARGAVVGLLLPADATCPVRPGGPAREWWRARAANALQAELHARGIPLLRRWHHTVLDTLLAVAAEHNADAVFWHRRFAAAEAACDESLAVALRQRGLWVEQFPGTLLHDPLALAREHGGPYRVFTAFWRRLQQLQPPLPLPAPIPREPLSVGLRPSRKEADPQRDLFVESASWAAFWTPTEAAAQEQLSSFVAHGLKTYRCQRDELGIRGTSRLSPYLAHGQVSPRQIWHAVQVSPVAAEEKQAFLRQLAWREFAYHTLVHAPDLHARSLRPEVDAFLWQRDSAEWRERWQTGHTGIPIVDAGMRELAATGWMHNRARMVVASWLTKNLQLHWIPGERWFWDHLLDADPANNPFGWQWVAGCGADAAPYFRVFHPVRQGEKFDKSGSYVRRWVPELASLAAPYVHCPWVATQDVLNRAGVQLGKTYPLPMVDPELSREAALAAFERLRQSRKAT